MRSGFSVLELLIGCALLTFVVSMGAYSLRPVNEANRRFRLTNRAHRLEDEIRRGIYYQSNYANPSGLVIEVAGVAVAREGETLYVNEDFSKSVRNTDPDFDKKIYPLATKIALVQNTATSQWGLIYQVQSSDESRVIATLGTRSWPDSPSNYINENSSVDHSVVHVPSEIASSISKNCQAGIMRGVLRNVDGTYNPVCWEYQAPTEIPAWSIPTSITLVDSTSKIKVQYSSLNRPRCPDMTIANLAGKSWKIPNFYAFKTLDLRDFFPAKAAGAAMASECEKVIDFLKHSNDGLLPKSMVNDSSINNRPGNCPDKNLYVLNPDGSCRVDFRPSDIPERAPAMVSP